MMAKAKSKEEIVISLDQDKMKGKTLLPFYVYVAECMGYKDETVEIYDCRKILVAENVQDAIIEAYREKCPNEYAEYPMDVDQEIMKTLAICGPKMSEELLDNQVKVEDGFITFKDSMEGREEVVYA